MQRSVAPEANATYESATERWRRHPFLTRLKQFVTLTDEDRECLRRSIEGDLAIAKRSDLVVEGYEYRKLCFVEDGYAARYKLLRNGKRQIINLLLPGDVVGLPGSFVEKAGHSVIALTSLKLQVCPIRAYTDLCYQRPQFGLILAWLAVQETITCAEHIVSNGRRTPVERLAHFFLEIHSRLAMVGRAGPWGFVLPFSQEVISDTLGLSVPHINRTLAKLRADGFVRNHGRHIKFVDAKALELLAHFQPLDMTRIAPPTRDA